MSSRAGRLVRNSATSVGRMALLTMVVPFYVLGVLAAAVVAVALTIAGAVRLGWSDTRKRAHGPA